MPIKIERTTNPETGKPLLKIEIDNGDLGGFNDAKDKWTFKDEASMLKYIIAVMLNSPNKKLYVDDGNTKRALEPIDNLLTSNQPAEDSKHDDSTKPE